MGGLWWVFLLVACRAQVDDQPKFSQEVCTDGYDNDGDGDIDCLDADCALAPFCLDAPPAPTGQTADTGPVSDPAESADSSLPGPTAATGHTGVPGHTDLVEDTGHTGADDTGKHGLHPPGLIGFTATFGVDRDGVTAPVNLDGETVPATLEVVIATLAWAAHQDPLSDEMCTVWFAIDRLTNAPWARPDGFWYGLDLPSPPQGGHDCQAFDLSGFEGADPFEHFSDPAHYPGWALAIGGELHDEVENQLILDEDLFFGGLVRTAFIDEERQPVGFTRAFEVDPDSLDVLLDGLGDPVPMDVSEVPSPNGVHPGLYRLTHLYLYLL